MFDDFQEELNGLEQGLTLSIPVEPDEEGYFDKECPAENCLFQFKVNAEDWVVNVRPTMYRGCAATVCHRVAAMMYR